MSLDIPHKGSLHTQMAEYLRDKNAIGFMQVHHAQWCAKTVSHLMTWNPQLQWGWLGTDLCGTSHHDSKSSWPHYPSNFCSYRVPVSTCHPRMWLSGEAQPNHRFCCVVRASHICSTKMKTMKISFEESGCIAVKFCTNWNFSLYSIC